MQKSKKNRKYKIWYENRIPKTKKKKLINYVFRSELWESFLNIEIY